MGIGPHTLLKPVFFMFMALLSLKYFQIVYNLITRIAHYESEHPLWKALAPYARQSLANVQANLGPAETMSFSITHVLLAAILLCLTIR